LRPNLSYVRVMLIGIPAKSWDEGTSPAGSRQNFTEFPIISANSRGR
jgi:hypothetical protein